MKKLMLNRVNTKSPNYKKYYALVDDEDYEKVNKYNWNISGDRRYVHSRINDKLIYLHTFITGFKRTDHINGNGLDCQRKNMRKATQQQNSMNKIKTKGTSKYKGVYWCSRTKKWQAQIMFNYKQNYIGRFLSEENAGQAYNFMAEKLFGRYARYNVVH